MKSQTKRELTRDEIVRMCRSAFGSDSQLQSYQSLDDGMYNASYQLTLSSDGQVKVCVLKVSPTATVPVMTYERDIMHTEYRVYQLIQEQTSVPVPQMIYKNFSRNIICPAQRREQI